MNNALNDHEGDRSSEISGENLHGPEGVLVPQALRGANAQNVHRIAGREMQNVPGFAEALKSAQQPLREAVRQPSGAVSSLHNPVSLIQPAAIPVLSTRRDMTPKENFTKAVVGGATLGMLYPVVELGRVAGSFASVAIGANSPGFAVNILSSAAKQLAPFLGVPLATGILGRYIGKKFNRPGTGAVLGAGLGLGATHLALGTALSTLAVPVGVGVTAGAAYYGLRKFLKGR